MKFDLKTFSFDSGEIKVDNVFKPLHGLGVQLVGGLIVFLASCIWAPWYAPLSIGLIEAGYFGFFMKKYDYFSKKDPDRLQSETYLIERKKIEIGPEKNRLFIDGKQDDEGYYRLVDDGTPEIKGTDKEEAEK
jgi:hypothetical protein